MSETSTSTHTGSTDTSPVVAALLSLLIPGVGLIVAGEPVKTRGIYWLAGAVIAGILLFGFSIVTLGLGAVLWLAWPVVHIAAAADSYLQVDKLS